MLRAIRRSHRGRRTNDVPVVPARRLRPTGSGKTTVAHLVARGAGCPAVSRDGIKEGMVHTRVGYPPGPDDELTARTPPVFFSVLELLLTAGVTTVAEAGFQNRAASPPGDAEQS